MLVKDVMSTQLETINPSTSIQECARKMDRAGVGALPVWEDGAPVGVVTDRDICCRVVGAGKDPTKTPVRAVMSKTATCCFDDQDCEEAVRLMKDKGIRRLTVVNHDKAMVGVLSVDDIARFSHDLAGEVLETVAPWPH